MPVSNRTWNEREIRIGDSVSGAAEQAGISPAEIVGVATAYLNAPRNWSTVSEEGPIVECVCATRNGHRRRIRLGVATYGNWATVFHYDTDVSEGELAEPLVFLSHEFAADEEPFDYVPRKRRSDRTVTVKVQRRGRRPPLRFEGEP